MLPNFPSHTYGVKSGDKGNFLSIRSNCLRDIFFCSAGYGREAGLPYRPKAGVAEGGGVYVPGAFLFAVGVAASAFTVYFRRLRQVDGSSCSLCRCFDERSEQNVRQWVEPGMHRDHIGGTDNSRSAALTVIPFLLLFLPTHVKSKSQFCISIYRYPCEASVFPFAEKVGFYPSDGICARYGINDTASLLHQGRSRRVRR